LARRGNEAVPSFSICYIRDFASMMCFMPLTGRVNILTCRFTLSALFPRLLAKHLVDATRTVATNNALRRHHRLPLRRVSKNTSKQNSLKFRLPLLPKNSRHCSRKQHSSEGEKEYGWQVPGRSTLIRIKLTELVRQRYLKPNSSRGQ